MRGCIVRRSILLVVCLAVAHPALSQYREMTRETAPTHLDELYDQFVNNRADDLWWEVPDFSDFSRFMNETAVQESLIIGALDLGRPDTDFGHAVYELLSNLQVTVYNHGSTFSVFSQPPDGLDGFQVCFVPANTDGLEGLNTVGYVPDFHALFVPAVDWPMPLYSLLLYHAGGHAILSIQTALPVSMQETTVEDVGLAVLDKLTDGQGIALLDTILDRSDGIFATAVQNVTLEDLREFERLLGADASFGPIVAANVFDQFLELLYRRSCAKHTLGS